MSDDMTFPHRVGRLEGLIDLFLRGLIDRDQLERQFADYRADVERALAERDAS